MHKNNGRAVLQSNIRSKFTALDTNGRHTASTRTLKCSEDNRTCSEEAALCKATDGAQLSNWLRHIRQHLTHSAIMHISCLR